ncbi:MAG: sigma-54-dependent Fis family transcriptional regulator, partial [Firmicutes bacterium]|nr:sigma-54-dependent Fis family transcriptional regulator [Bacillota bacterium]
RKRKPSQISRDELVLALRRHRYELQATADDLGISRASVYQLIERHPDLKHTADLTDDELTHCYNEFKGDLERMMEHLEVSQIGLRRRLRAMGLDA